MSMASSNNKNCEVLVAPCQEQDKIMAGFAGLSPGGKIGKLLVLVCLLLCLYDCIYIYYYTYYYHY